MDYVTLRNRAEDYDKNILRMICKTNAHSPPFLLGSNLAANCCLLITSFNVVSCHGHSAISTSSGATPPSSVQFSSVAQSCLTLCDPMNHSMPALPYLHHQLLEFTQTHVHPVSDAIQPSHPLSSPSPPAPNPSQHQSLFQ